MTIGFIRCLSSHSTIRLIAAHNGYINWPTNVSNMSSKKPIHNKAHPNPAFVVLVQNFADTSNKSTRK